MTNLEALKLSQKIELRLLRIKHALDIFELKEKDMAVSQAVADLIVAFDTATDKIAARIASLIANSGTLSADDKAALQAEVDKLNLLGQDPNNPVPPSVA